MNDPHVEKLYYDMIIAEHIDYDKAIPIEEETEDFIMSTEGKSVIFSMKKHFAKELDARNLADNYLKKWEVLIGIHRSPDEIKFRFKDADIIDRAPLLDGSTTIHVKSARLVLTTMNANVHISYNKYPDLPKEFELSTDVEMLYSRYKLYRENSETLLGMAFWCLTILETSAGGKPKARKKAEKKYQIEFDVLDTLGKISSTKGDANEARKVKSGQPLISLTHAEKIWIEAVIKAIIIRVGEYVYDPDAEFKKITMSDFSDLKD